MTDSVTVWAWAFPPEMFPTVCVWLVAAANSLLRDVDMEIVPEDAPRFATVWSWPLLTPVPAYVWVCPLAAVWLEYVAVVV